MAQQVGVEALEAYTVGEVAVRLRVHERTVRRMCATGELDSVRAGRLIRVPASALAAYLTATTSAQGAT